jgi:hypothetical protein
MSENIPEQGDTQELSSEIAVYESPWGEIRVVKGDDMTLVLEFSRRDDSEQSLLPGALYIQVRQGNANTHKLREEIERLVEQEHFKSGLHLQRYIDKRIAEIDGDYSIPHSVDNMIPGLYSDDGIDD